MKYIIKLTPLNSYFFGGNDKFSFKPKKDEKSEYYIKSNLMPQQTTIYGAIRYLILSLSGILKSDWDYSPDDKKNMKKHIGDSFSLDNEYDTGYIINIGTVYLMKNHKLLIPVPQDHLNQDILEYAPMSVKDHEYKSNLNKRVRVFNDYNAKKGLFVGWMDQEGNIIDDSELFGIEVREGNQKEGNEKAFFKREYRFLKKGVSFVFDITLDDKMKTWVEKSNNQSVISLGQKKSMFKVELEVNKELQRISLKQHSKNDKIAIAMSDIYISAEKLDKIQLVAAVTKDFNYLKLNGYQKHKSFENVYSTGDNKYILIKSGAVFIFNNRDEKNKFIQECQNDNLTKIGYNNIVEGDRQ